MTADRPETALPDWLTRIRLPMPATLGEVNVYLVRGPRGAALVDTGMRDALSQQELLRRLAEQGFGLRDIDAVICTHHHADHAGLGATVRDAGAVAMMSAADATSLARFFAEPELDAMRATFFGRHEVPDEFEERVARMFPFFRGLAEDFAPQRLLEDKEVVDLGGLEFEVLLTPGHTPGHVCLRALGAPFVLTGDCVLDREATHVSMRSESMGTDPLAGFLGSLGRLQGLGRLVALPGHGEPIGDLGVRAAELLEHHRLRLLKVEAALADAPRTAYDISVDALGPKPKAFARWLAVSQTLAYLEHLASAGRAREIETERGLRYRAFA